MIQRIADAALQEDGDVLVELAVLPTQGGNRHEHGRPDVSQAKDRLFDWAGMSAAAVSASRPAADGPPLPSLWPALHHLGHYTSRKYDQSTLT